MIESDVRGFLKFPMIAGHRKMANPTTYNSTTYSGQGHSPCPEYVVLLYANPTTYNIFRTRRMALVQGTARYLVFLMNTCKKL